MEVRRWIFLVLLLPIMSWADFKAQDPELTNYTYPFKVSFKEIKNNEQILKMAYMDVNPEKPNGKTVVLLHGKNFSGAYWKQTAEDLLQRGFRVVMPDQIGFGKSSKPHTFPFTFHYLSELTQNLLKDLKVEEYFLVGHSMGGMLAIRMALMFPKSVTKLLLINPIGLEDWKLSTPYKNVYENYQNELKSNLQTIKGYQQNVYYDGVWKPEYDQHIEYLVGWTKHPRYKEVAWNSALTTDMCFTQPVFYERHLLKMPTLLLIGTRDRTAIGKGWASLEMQKKLGRYDLLGKEFMKPISKGKLVEIENVGHMPQVEVYPRYIKEVLNFIGVK